MSLNKVIGLLHEAKQHGIDISLFEGGLQLKTSNNQVIHAPLLEELKNNKKLIIDYLLQSKWRSKGSAGYEDMLIPVERDITSHIPLSYSQERLWFIHQLQGSVQYHMPWVFRLEGVVDRGRLEEAFRQIVNRHEVLRTVIREENGVGYQQVMEAEGWRMDHVGAVDKEEQYIQDYIGRPFDLSSDRMLRVLLISHSAEEHVLVMVLHHIAFDGWSIPILVEELVQLYRSSAEGQKAQLKEPAVQYADYAIWQRRYSTGVLFDAKLEYWKEQLKELEPLHLSTDHQRSVKSGIKGATVNRLIGREVVNRLIQRTRPEGVTIFMTLLSVLKVLLYRYTGQNDICVGSPVAGRQQQKIEGLIGLFVNTIAFRSRLEGHKSFRDLLKRVRQTTLDGYARQDVPFERIVDILKVDRDMGHNPVFQVLFSLQNNPGIKKADLGDVKLTGLDPMLVMSKFDISFDAAELDGGLYLSATYNTGLFRKDTVERMLGHYERLIQTIADGLDITLDRLELSGPAERQQLLDWSEGPELCCRRDQTVLDLFTAQVQRTPDAEAVTYEEIRLSYRELDERSNQLAHYLLDQQLRAGEKIGLLMDRGWEMMVAIMGILKAGGAYVPLDPSYPQERLAYMIADSECRIVLDKGLPYIASFPKAPVERMIAPDSLAYVIYTSGSTGRPKGVLVEHGSVMNLVVGQSRTFSIDQTDSILQFSNYCFDASVEQIFLALCNGATLVLTPQKLLSDPDGLEEMLQKQRITHLHATPSFLETIAPGGYAGLRRVIAGGEACSRALVERWRKTVAFYNEYGPTETTVTAVEWKAPDGEEALPDIIPIGRPLAGTRAYIIDNTGGMAGIGIPGELCIGGVQVARGYQGMPELTAERFAPDPYSREEGARMYRTGDRAKWLADGNIMFLGRFDDQVKIRGYRIEPGEIQNCLNSIQAISKSAVIAQKDRAGRLRLLAYIETDGPFHEEQIIHQLQERLPEYMIPSLVQIDRIPLNSVGKIDKKRLPDIDLLPDAADTFIAPATQCQKDMVAIWQELLGTQKIGIHDNFFQLGGDSIITLQVVSRARRMGYFIDARDMFLNQTIEKIAAVISQRKDGPVAAITGEQGLLEGDSPLLPAQRSFLNTGARYASHYNQSALFAIDKAFGREDIEYAINRILEQHDALRYVYGKTPEGWVQRYGYYKGEVDLVSLEALPASESGDALALKANEYQQSLDIELGILIRAVLFTTCPSYTHNRLLLIIHHLAIDGVSWRILLEDLTQILQGKRTGRIYQPGDKTASCRQWYEALVHYGRTERLLTQREYWDRIERRHIPLPCDRNAGDEALMKDYNVLTFHLGNKRTMELLTGVAAVFNTEINDILLSALARTFAGWLNGKSVTFGLEGHGREGLNASMDISRTVGWFTSMYPVLLEFVEEMSPAELIIQVKEQLRKIPDKGIGYGVLRHIVDPSAADALSGRTPPWDIVFNYLGQIDNITKGNEILTPAYEAIGKAINPGNPPLAMIEINAIVQHGSLSVAWNYSGVHFQPATIEDLGKKFIDNLGILIDHCTRQQGKVYTPSDFGLGRDITYQELDTFLKKNDGMEEIMSF